MAFRAIFYFLVKNPATYRKLMDEITQAEQEGKLSDFVEFQQGLELKYLFVQPSSCYLQSGDG